MNYTAIPGEQLISYLQRIENLEEEKKNLQQDIKEVLLDAKTNGFDPKILRKVLRIRRMDPQERFEEEELIESYLKAIDKAYPQALPK